MIRIVAGGALLIMLVAVGYIYLSKPKVASITDGDYSTELNIQKEKLENSEGKGDIERLGVLEDSVATLIKQISIFGTTLDKLTKDGPSALIDQRLDTLDTKVASLEGRVGDLEQQSTPNPTASVSPTSKPSPLYIPLGARGISNGGDWRILDDFQVDINPDDYPNYKSMVLEVVVRLIQVDRGEAQLRLYNYSDSKEITDSYVSTKSEKYVLVESKEFTLNSGEKAYRLQVKSTLGTEMQIQTARIRVNF